MQAGSRGCNGATGSVEVLDVGFDAQGAVTRLWALFDHHCEGARSSAFGELRWRAWVPEAAAHVTPGVLRWPVLDSWWPAAPATVVYHGSAPATSVAVAGEDAGQFTVRADGCTGQRPPCTVEVGFAPTAPGARRARLEIVDTAGVRHAVTLEGFLHGGTTRADIEVLAGDVAAPPEDRGVHAYGPADARFSGVEYAPNPIVSLFVQDDDDQHEWWNLRLYAGGGAAAAAGRELPRRAGERGRPRPRRRRLRRPGMVQPDRERVHRPLDQLHAGRRTAVVRHELRAPLLRRPAARRARDLALPRGRRRPARALDGARTAAADRCAAGAGPAPTGVDRAPVSDRRATGSAARRDRRRAALLPPEGLPAGRGRPRPARHARADVLRGTRRADLIRGRAGNDRIDARAGADCVLGGPGNDLLVGGPGRDLLDCGPGRDRVVAGPGDRVRSCERRLTRRP